MSSWLEQKPLVGAGGLQVQVDWVVDGDFHLGGIILTIMVDW